MVLAVISNSSDDNYFVAWWWLGILTALGGENDLTSACAWFLSERRLQGHSRIGQRISIFFYKKLFWDHSILWRILVKNAGRSLKESVKMLHIWYSLNWSGSSFIRSTSFWSYTTHGGRLSKKKSSDILAWPGWEVVSRPFFRCLR